MKATKLTGKIVANNATLKRAVAEGNKKQNQRCVGTLSEAKTSDYVCCRVGHHDHPYIQSAEISVFAQHIQSNSI